MRDNHQGYPEIIDSIEIDGLYYGIIGITINDVEKFYRIGITVNGYKAIKRIIQSRPFGTAVGVNYRYFFSGRAQCSNFSDDRNDDTEYMAGIHVESGIDRKTIDYKMPRKLIQNLNWFFIQKSFDAVEGIPEVDRTGSVKDD